MWRLEAPGLLTESGQAEIEWRQRQAGVDDVWPDPFQGPLAPLGAWRWNGVDLRTDRAAHIRIITSEVVLLSGLRGLSKWMK